MSFKCTECGKTWPDNKDEGDGTCPVCYEPEDDEDGYGDEYHARGLGL